jgi:plasmid stability protein
MAAVTVRNLPDETVARLRVRAAQRGRSMEAELRQTLIALANEDAGAPANGVDEAAVRRRQDINRRVESIHADLRTRLGGELPKGRVDAFIAERRAAAERGE